MFAQAWRSAAGPKVASAAVVRPDQGHLRGGRAYRAARLAPQAQPASPQARGGCAMKALKCQTARHRSGQPLAVISECGASPPRGATRGHRREGVSCRAKGIFPGNQRGVWMAIGQSETWALA